MNTGAAIFYTQESYSLMKTFLTVVKIEGIVALTIKGSCSESIKNVSCRSCMQHIVMTCST